MAHQRAYNLPSKVNRLQYYRYCLEQRKVHSEIKILKNKLAPINPSFAFFFLFSLFVSFIYLFSQLKREKGIWSEHIKKVWTPRSSITMWMKIHKNNLKIMKEDCQNEFSHKYFSILALPDVFSNSFGIIPKLRRKLTRFGHTFLCYFIILFIYAKGGGEISKVWLCNVYAD